MKKFLDSLNLLMSLACLAYKSARKIKILPSTT